MVLALFTAAFVIGPALFLALERLDGRRWPLALTASVLVVFSFMLRSDAGLSLSVDLTPLALSLLLIWLAWILVLVLVARALRATVPTPRARRWGRAICAVGTTVPWFGFVTARMMGGP